MTSRRSKLAALLVAASGILATAAAVNAQGGYYVNNQPASPGMTQMMAARGLPFGYYWLQGNGNWGFAGNSDAVANIHGRQPSLSERGRLFYPGELLK